MPEFKAVKKKNHMEEEIRNTLWAPLKDKDIMKYISNTLES